MTVSLKHKFVSNVPDAGNPEELGPNEWNDEHDLICSDDVILGRVGQGSAGPAQEQSITGTGSVVLSDGATLTSPDISTPTGIVKSDVGLGNVDNTSDADKPISDATQTALDAKVAGPVAATDSNAAAFDGITGKIIKDSGKAFPTGAIVGTSDIQTLTNKTLTSPAISSPTGIVKADVGLSNVDNTADANKPVSTATQTALDLKAPLASPTFTGTPAAPTAAAGTNTTQLATTAFVTGAVTNLINAAPSTLDTLNELANALGDDANFAATTATSLAAKVAGPASATDGNVALFDGATGKLVKDGGTFSSLSGAWLDAGINSTFSGTYQDAQTPFGAGFVSGHVLRSGGTGTHTDSKATLSVLRTAEGSGTTGPDTSDYAALFSSEKTDYLTSTVEGEIDAAYFIAHQGRNGDVGSILIDLEKVFTGDAGDTGGGVCIEVAAKGVDATGTVTQNSHSIVGFREGAGGYSGGDGYGFWAESQVGNPFSAFHADYVTGAPWQKLLSLAVDRTTDKGSIDGTFCGQFGGGTASVPAFGFHIEGGNGMYRVSANRLGFATASTLRFYFDTNGAFTPGADNTYSLGQDGARVSAIWAATSTISTSGAATKTDIADSDLGLDFINKLRPVSYRFKEGGNEIAYEDGEEEVEDFVYDEKGEPIFDVVDALDRNGRPVVKMVPTGLVDKDGKPTFREVRKKQRKYRRAMVKKPVRVPVAKPVAGKRTHYGLIAEEVKAALDAVGNRDFGGYIVADINDPESARGLRYEAFIAPLVKAVQQLAGEVEALKNRNSKN